MGDVAELVVRAGQQSDREAAYERGKKLTARAMDALEQRMHRMPGLEKYFVDIPWQPEKI